MRIKPEDLRVANKIAGMKDSSEAAKKKTYWNGVYRLVAKPSSLLLMSTDLTTWLEWYMPAEGDPVPNLDALVQARNFDSARHLEGGSLEVKLENNIVTLEKGQMHFRMHEEKPESSYPTVEIGENPKSWVCDSNSLAKALKFVAPFIDETNPNPNKSVATLFTSGKILGGSPQKMAKVTGLKAESVMSFKSKSAKLIATFLDAIGDKVKISVTDKTYTFEDPENKHRFVVLAEVGEFPETSSTEKKIREKLQIDRKTLLIRVLAFSGNMQIGAERLNLSFQGQEEHASLRIFTPGDQMSEVTDDEFPIYREFPPIAGESPQDLEARKGPAKFGVNHLFLKDALEQMEGTNVTIKNCGRSILVEDEVVTEGTVAPERSVMIAAAQERRAVTLPPDETPATPAPAAVVEEVPETASVE